MTEVHMQPILAHGGGLDEFLLVLALVGLPLAALAILARRVRPDDDDEELPVE
jgi:hypothetical protein